jgi:hypothetical protein
LLIVVSMGEVTLYVIRAYTPTYVYRKVYKDTTKYHSQVPLTFFGYIDEKDRETHHHKGVWHEKMPIPIVLTPCATH